MAELRAVVRDALRRVGRDAVPKSIQILAGGLSGSSVLALDVDGEAVILKVTVPAPERVEQARREVLYYQDLASWDAWRLARRRPLPTPR